MALGCWVTSARGLQAKERRTLYRSCVLPIATYGHRLWYYNGAPCKGVMKILGQMQRKAAILGDGGFSHLAHRWGSGHRWPATHSSSHPEAVLAG